MDSYRILLGPIFDGAALHEEGGTISLAEADAAPLVELGIIEPAHDAEPAPSKGRKAREVAD